MPAHPAIAQFTEEQLERAPTLFDDVLLAMLARLTRPSADDPPDERIRGGELAQALAAQRHRMVADFSSSLALRARQELANGPAAAPGPATPFAPAKLELVDETAVAADVETSRAAETIKSVTEHELRELNAFLSALAGEPMVVPHHMTFHPDHQARALWDAAKLLPDEKELRPRFMRQVASPLAIALRKQWASACTRLEDAGVVPAAYRTVILNAGTRVDAGLPAGAPASLDGVTRALELIGRRLMNETSGAASVTTAHVARHAPYSPELADSAVATAEDTAPPVATPPLPDPRLATLERIFDAFQRDARIEPDLRPSIECLRKPALQSATADTMIGLIDKHPLWSLIDRIAWQGRTLPAPPHRERVRAMMVVKGLADQLAKEPKPTAARFRWALDRVVALELNRLERRSAQHAAQIAALEALDHDLAAGPGGHAPRSRRSDFGQLLTVPSNLYDATPAPAAALPPADAWLDTLAPSSVAKLLIQGRWVLAQLIWHSPSGELWLWADCTTDELWPIRRGALCMLFQGGLAGSASPEGVVQEIIKDAGVRAARDSRH